MTNLYIGKKSPIKSHGLSARELQAMACSLLPSATLSILRVYSLERLHAGIQFAKPSKSACRSMASSTQPLKPVAQFGWPDVVREAERGDDDPSDLRGYLQRVRACNRGSELQSQFVPFLVDDEVVGYIHECFIKHLIKFQDVFTFMLDEDGHVLGPHVTLRSSLKTPEDRTRAFGGVIKCLGDLILSPRNELYPVTTSFGKQILFLLERAAAPYFGIKTYGIHVNGYVMKSGQKLLWVGKRSDFKPTYPGMLDHIVAGGLPFGITCKENLVKECEEEAGIPRPVAENAISVGAVSYSDIEGYRFKRDVLFCFDLELSSDFVPKNKDGEVDSFKLIPVHHVASIVRRTELFKPNCSLVIMDFLIRHGFIGPHDFGYLPLLHSLRSKNCL